MISDLPGLGELPDFSVSFRPRAGQKGWKYRTQCAAPSHVWIPSGPSYRRQETKCGHCKHCMWVKRNIRASECAMELVASDWAYFLTLTVAPGEDRDKDAMDWLLDIQHLQRFHKRCRINIERQKGSFVGRECTSWRYVQCGEYGSLRGRAHYHVVIFGNGERPHFNEGKFEHIPEWPYGHVTIRSRVDRGVAFYLSKYMQKSQEDVTCYSQSNVPALGTAYILGIAARNAGLGLPIPSGSWKFVTSDGIKDRSFLIRGAKVRDYALAFARAQGKAAVDYLQLMPQQTHGVIRRADKWERVRRERAELKTAMQTEVGKLMWEIEQRDKFLLEHRRAKPEGKAMEEQKRVQALPIVDASPDYVPVAWRLPQWQIDARRAINEDRKQLWARAPPVSPALEGV